MSRQTAQSFVTDWEREKALRIARDPMFAPVTLDTLCLLSLALRDAEARAAEFESRLNKIDQQLSEF